MAKPTEHEIVESAQTAIESILRMPILAEHQRGLINGMLWAITQARGKYATRYRSAAAQAAPAGTKLQHDHVTTRKHLVDEIMACPERARSIAGTAIGCVVTREEHATLNRITREQPNLLGWDRYTAAGIKIIDTDE